jgi:hypothetical protein
MGARAAYYVVPWAAARQRVRTPRAVRKKTLFFGTHSSESTLYWQKLINCGPFARCSAVPFHPKARRLRPRRRTTSYRLPTSAASLTTDR